jgi:hypothetical protein
MAVYIGESNFAFAKGESYSIVRNPMTGRIYQPGKGPDGKWLDKIGKKDNRIMVYKSTTMAAVDSGYKVYETQEDIEKDWEF